MKSSLILAGVCISMISQAQVTTPNERVLADIEGAVLAPGSYMFAPGSRLLDASATGKVSAQAWALGAALLRQSAMEPQVRLKAGILFDLQINRVHALAEDNVDLQALIDRLKITIESMPVTGRIVAQLNPLQQLLPANNDPLENGDRIRYPRRPDHVTVTGAVERDCKLNFSPAFQPADYLRLCNRLSLADPSYIYVIQPDGKLMLHGIAHWNAEQANVAVGAVLYVPVKPGRLSAETPDINRELAEFLATQYQLGGRFGE
ncbi:MAG: capsule biosynthesis GfcC family protein [Pseudomonas profundi]|uniref:capsule biosynthesis GfcC family protein n=1 Tax=Pseudomonas profundi TaxID=1981513 RepID=UPI0030018020